MFKVLYRRPWCTDFDWQYSPGAFPPVGTFRPPIGLLRESHFLMIKAPGWPHAEILMMHFFSSIERRELQLALRLYLSEYYSQTKNNHYLWPDNGIMGNYLVFPLGAIQNFWRVLSPAASWFFARCFVR